MGKKKRKMRHEWQVIGTSLCLITKYITLRGRVHWDKFKDINKSQH